MPVKSVKLRKTLAKSLLYFKETETVLCEIKSVISSSPFIYSSKTINIKL